jgi:RNA-directed DNA polymerase
MSGRLWKQGRIVRYYLHRWPSQESMKRARARVRALTGRSRVGMELEDVIHGLNLFLFLRGGDNYFRTGNAATKFRQLNRSVAWRHYRLLSRSGAATCGPAARWTEDWFHDPGLHRLRGTIPEGGVTMSR